MALEEDLAVTPDIASDGNERPVEELDLQEEDELPEEVKVLEQEEPFVAAFQQTEIDHSTQRGLAEIVRVPCPVLRDPYLCENDVEAGVELDWIETTRPVRVEPAKPHATPSIRAHRFWDDTQEGPANREGSALARTVHRPLRYAL